MNNVNFEVDRKYHPIMGGVEGGHLYLRPEFIYK
jgi:hypothetical protein